MTARTGQLRHLVRLATRQGWSVTRTRGCHWCWRSPDGQRIYTSSTPSDPRSDRNHLARLRRAGLRLEER